jgi:Domain of unknown function (DUF5658)
MRSQDGLKVFGRRWLPTLLVGWAVLQAFDVILTYWGLKLPSEIQEANPVMAGVISYPARVILMKAGLTIGVIALLLHIEYRSRFSSIPILFLLNILMMYVFFNNWSLIATAGSHILISRVGG